MNRPHSLSSPVEMRKKTAILRFLTVARSQWHALSLAEFLPTVGQSLFRNDPVLIYMKELDRRGAVEQGRWAHVKPEKGCMEELETAASDQARLPWEFQCHHYDGVSDFFVVKNGGVIQHISWIYYERDPNRILRLGRQDAEVKYALTLPAFRGMGLYPATLNAIASFLAARSFRRLFICVKSDNSDSISGIEKAGFRRVGALRLRKVLGFQTSRPFTPKEV